MDVTDTAESGELSLFAYPWDLAGQDLNRVTAWAADSGVDRLVVATAYHSAEMLLPRRRTGVLLHAEANRVHLPLSAYKGPLALFPSSIADEHPRLFDELAEAARGRGTRLTAWIVTLHNSSLASDRTDLAMLNCFGDRLSHGLCPTNPTVQEHVGELVAATAATGHFDEVFLESLSFLPLGHGHPHELWSVPLEPLDRLLASLCFCPACEHVARQRGVEVDALRRWVTDTLSRRWNAEDAGQRVAGDSAEVLSVVLARPDLAEFLRCRLETTGTLTQRMVDLAHEAGSSVAIGAPVFARPLAHAWLEGVDLADLAGRADRVTLMPYYDAVGEIQRDLAHARDLGLSDRAQMLQALWPTMHAGDKSVLLHKVAAARSLGVRDVGLYNLGTATEQTLRWIPDVADLVHASSP